MDTIRTLCLFLSFLPLHSFAQKSPSTFAGIDKKKLQADCKRDYETVAAMIEKQSQSEKERLLAGAKAETPPGQSIDLKAATTLGAGGIAGALLEYAVLRRERQQLAGAMATYLGYGTEKAFEAALKEGQMNAVLFRNAFFNFLQETEEKRLQEKIKSGTILNREYVKAQKQFAEELNAFRRGSDGKLLPITEEMEKKMLAHFKKKPVDDLVEERAKMLVYSGLSSKKTNYAEAGMCSAEKELISMIHLESTMSRSSIISKLGSGALKGFGIGMAASLLGDVFSGSREAPELQWADAVNADPSLLLNPEAMKGNGILQSTDTWTSEAVACLAFQRHREKMMGAAKKLVKNMEGEFQGRVNYILYGDTTQKTRNVNDVNGKKCYLAPNDATAYNKAIIIQNPVWAKP